MRMLMNRKLNNVFMITDIIINMSRKCMLIKAWFATSLAISTKLPICSHSALLKAKLLH